MSKWADLHRRQQKASVTSAKAVQELNKSYVDRENKVNGYAGGASDILVRFSPKTTAATFGTNGGSTVGA